MYYPVNLNMVGKRCLVVGGGSVAARKVGSLVECGAVVTVVAPYATDTITEMAALGQIDWIKGEYAWEHLAGVFLAIAATDIRLVNAAVARDCKDAGVLVCCADAPEDGDVTLPARVMRGDLLLTVSTAGQSPTLSAMLRERLATEFGEEWAALTAIVGDLRYRIQEISGEAERRAAVQRICEDEVILNMLKNGQITEAGARADECLSSY